MKTKKPSYVAIVVNASLEDGRTLGSIGRRELMRFAGSINEIAWGIRGIRILCPDAPRPIQSACYLAHLLKCENENIFIDTRLNSDDDRERTELFEEAFIENALVIIVSGSEAVTSTAHAVTRLFGWPVECFDPRPGCGVLLAGQRSLQVP